MDGESPSESDGALHYWKRGDKTRQSRIWLHIEKEAKMQKNCRDAKTERSKSDWIRDKLILTNSTSHWVCVSSWDLLVKRMIVAIVAICYRKNSLSCFNLGKLETTENPNMSSFIYRRFNNMKKDLVLCIAVAIHEIQMPCGAQNCRKNT